MVEIADGPTPSDRLSDEASDAWDDSRLADVLDDSPERIHSDPLPSTSSFPHGQKSDDRKYGPVDARGNQLRPAAESSSKDGASKRTSISHWDPEPGFAHIDGDIGGSGYNETTVDIITVPCPGADPVETWTRDPLPDGFFGNPLDNELTTHPALKELAGDAILSPGIASNFPRAAHLWVRQGIRRYASMARVLLYRHRELTDHTNLDQLAQDLLENVLLTRDEKQESRPLFFIAHSVGGLVVKKALVLAGQSARYLRPILYNCHGVTFFATPHRGSSYESMYSLGESIQLLLHLQRPLPRSLTNDIRIGSKTLVMLQEDFKDIVSEMQIWTFYETIDSELSGSGSGLANEVQFSAPLVSIKSAILGVRQEHIYSSLESDHAHCASFGITNPRTLNTYLLDLAAAISKAEALSQTKHNTLKLKEKVKVEIIGFYEDPDAGLESDVRLYISRYHLHDFLQKGPEQCLEERLRRVPQRHGSSRGHDSIYRRAHDAVSDARERLRAIPRSPERDQPAAPGIILTEPSNIDEGYSSVRPGLHLHSLTIPKASPSGFGRPSSRGSHGTTSTMSEPSGRNESSAEAVSKAPDGLDQQSSTEKQRTGLVSGSRSRAERRSESMAIQDLSAGFSRPISDQRKFMWIHLPFTNPLWVEDIFDKLSKTGHQDFSSLFNNENWVSRHVQGRHSQSQPSFVKPAVHFVNPDSEPSPRPSSSSSSGQPGGSGPTPTYLYLYLPYLHFDTYKHVIRRRNIVNRRLAQGRARPVPKDVAALDSLELRMVWQYLGQDPPLNGRRTLDQFGYPSLKDTTARDDDQMLYKLTKEEKSWPPSVFLAEDHPMVASLVKQYSSGTKLLHEMIEKEKEHAAADESENEAEAELRDGKLLMVDQLWLWAIDTTTLTTFFPKRESRPSEGALFQQADLRNSIYNELNGDLTGRCDNAMDLAAFVVLHAVTVLLDRSSYPDLEIFRIFEEAIGLLTERMTTNLKKFRMQTFKDAEDEDDDPEDNTASAIKKRHKRETERAERENRENTSALLELRDMEDELKTLNRLFDTQTTAIEKMVEIYSGDALKDLTHNGQGYLQEALGRLAEYKAQTTEMLERVGATRGDYEKLLEMAQRQAQVDDVRWSRLQTELASSQNLSVMIFTIFTVIFLPLSFFTSLFGMNTLEWGGADSGYPSLGFIGEISLPASVFMILATLIAAFSSRVQVASRSLARVVLGVWWTRARGGLRALQSDARRTAKEKKKADKERDRERERERRRKERSYDFWATVRGQRTLGAYEIPNVNRKLDSPRAGLDTHLSTSGDGVGSYGQGLRRAARGRTVEER